MGNVGFAQLSSRLLYVDLTDTPTPPNASWSSRAVYRGRLLLFGVTVCVPVCRVMSSQNVSTEQRRGRRWREKASSSDKEGDTIEWNRGILMLGFERRMFALLQKARCQ
ncbi:unnamed protein product [Knipowitschia caucasica]